MEKKQVIIVCGEASGDLHAANLCSALKIQYPQIKVFAVGGELLRKAKADVFYDIKDISVFGFFDALIKLPKFFALKKMILRKIREIKPDALILVDFSGFNLRLAKAINNANLTNSANSPISTIYYVSPQVWASRPGRINTIKKFIRRMIVLFKFEEDFYKKYGVDVSFVGHPLLDTVKPSVSKMEFMRSLHFTDKKTIVALLPGSRRQEILKILPVMLKAACLIHKKIPSQFVIAKSTQVDWQIYNRLIHGSPLDVLIVEAKTYDCLNIADFALVCSGTATLETAIMQKPFCVIYKMGLLNYLLYRPQVKVPYIGMVNIVAGKKIIPEFIQFGARPQKIADKVLEILKDPAKLQEIRNDLAKVKSSLGSPGAASRAAQLIL